MPSANDRRPTERLYLSDPYLLEFDADVVARREHEGRPAVVLDRTAFYAESGGQPWDTGSLGDALVLAVVEHEGELLHVLDRPLADGRARGQVDGERRHDHVQQHHGQHLLSKAFVETAGARTIAFHLGGELTTIDLDRPATAPQARAAERLANEVVWDARPVRVSVLSAAEARALGVEPPEGVTAGVRVVEAVGFDRQPCGGTHPRSTAEVGVIVVTGLERYKAGTRVSFVCGHRALAALAARQDALDELVATLSAPLDGLAVAARKMKEDLADGERRAKALLERAIDGDARRLLAQAQGDRPVPGADAAPALIVVALEGWSASDLRALAARIVALSPSVALLGSRADKAHLVFAQSEGLPHDVPALLKGAVETLGGRGGGRGNLAQGGGDRLDRLDDALAAAAAAVKARR
jgi:alanyl-tRNA synthetase